MIQLNCEVDFEDVEKRLHHLKGRTPTAVSRAINRAVDAVRVSMTKEAAKRYQIKQTDIRPTISVQKATHTELTGEAKSQTNSRIQLYQFKTSPGTPNPQKGYQALLKKLKGRKTSLAPVKARVLKGGGLKPLPGSHTQSPAFIAKMKSGHIGVFQRVKDSERGRSDRLSRRPPQVQKARDHAIIELYGPDIPAMIRFEKVSVPVRRRGEETLRKRLDHEINRILEEQP